MKSKKERHRLDHDTALDARKLEGALRTIPHTQSDFIIAVKSLQDEMRNRRKSLAMGRRFAPCEIGTDSIAYLPVKRGLLASR
jgi:hypothetical protein